MSGILCPSANPIHWDVCHCSTPLPGALKLIDLISMMNVLGTRVTIGRHGLAMRLGLVNNLGPSSVAIMISVRRMLCVDGMQWFSFGSCANWMGQSSSESLSGHPIPTTGEKSFFLPHPDTIAIGAHVTTPCQRSPHCHNIPLDNDE